MPVKHPKFLAGVLAGLGGSAAGGAGGFVIGKRKGAEQMVNVMAQKFMAANQAENKQIAQHYFRKGLTHNPNLKKESSMNKVAVLEEIQNEAYNDELDKIAAGMFQPVKSSQIQTIVNLLKGKGSKALGAIKDVAAKAPSSIKDVAAKAPSSIKDTAVRGSGSVKSHIAKELAALRTAGGYAGGLRYGDRARTLGAIGHSLKQAPVALTGAGIAGGGTAAAMARKKEK